MCVQLMHNINIGNVKIDLLNETKDFSKKKEKYLYIVEEKC